MGILGFLQGRSKSLIGLDISSSSVKMLELSKNGGRVKVESYLVRPLPPNTVVEKNVADVGVLTEVLRKLVSQKPKPRMPPLLYPARR